MALRIGAPASIVFPMDLRHSASASRHPAKAPWLVSSSAAAPWPASPLQLLGQHLRCSAPAGQQLCRSAQASNIFAIAAPRPATLPLRTGRSASPPQRRSAASSRWLSAAAPRLVCSFAAAPRPATSSRWHSAALLPASSSATAPRPAAPLRRPCQQQTSSGGEEYSGLASNLAHLGRIC